MEHCLKMYNGKLIEILNKIISLLLEKGLHRSDLLIIGPIGFCRELQEDINMRSGCISSYNEFLDNAQNIINSLKPSIARLIKIEDSGEYMGIKVSEAIFLRKMIIIDNATGDQVLSIDYHEIITQKQEMEI